MWMRLKVQPQKLLAVIYLIASSPSGTLHTQVPKYLGNLPQVANYHSAMNYGSSVKGPTGVGS
jgi:hypothetical protein